MKKLCMALPLLVVLSACASATDRFYALGPKPDAASARAAAPDVEVALTVSLPILVDRPQLVVQNAGGVRIQEHERWAGPLADQLQSVLGQDLERRRNDVFVTTRGTEPNAVRIDVDVISLTARVGSSVTLDVRWRLRSQVSAPLYGRESFSCRAAPGFSAIAEATSDCASRLADRLVEALPRR